QQETARRGISVAPAELDDKERQTAADFQAVSNPSPTPEPLTTPASVSDTGAAANTAATAIPTELPTPAALASPPAPTTPPAVPTLDAAGYAPALQQLLDKNNLAEPDFRDRLLQSMLREKLQTAIGQEQVPDTQEQVHARH